MAFPQGAWEGMPYHWRKIPSRWTSHSQYPGAPRVSPSRLCPALAYISRINWCFGLVARSMRSKRKVTGSNPMSSDSFFSQQPSPCIFSRAWYNRSTCSYLVQAIALGLGWTSSDYNIQNGERKRTPCDLKGWDGLQVFRPPLSTKARKYNQGCKQLEILALPIFSAHLGPNDNSRPNLQNHFHDLSWLVLYIYKVNRY